MVEISLKGIVEDGDFFSVKAYRTVLKLNVELGECV